jgi:hypothetical protein
LRGLRQNKTGLRHETGLLCLIALLTIVLSTTPAAAETSAREFLQMYASDDNQAAKIYLRGLHQGVSWSNTVLNYQKLPKLYCAPDTITLTDDQVQDVIRRLVEKEPLNGTYPIAMVMLKALQRAFPCPS